MVSTKVLFMGGVRDGVEHDVVLNGNDLPVMVRVFSHRDYATNQLVQVAYIKRLVCYTHTRIEVVYVFDDVPDSVIVKKLRELRGVSDGN